MSKSLNTFFSICIFLFTLLILLCLCFGFTFSNHVVQGVNLFVATIIPTLFPYFFITAILFELKPTRYISNKLYFPFSKAFKVGRASCYAFIVSIFSGYPIGAMTVSSLRRKGLITTDESVRSSILCSTSSPYFCVFTLGIITFNSATIGIIVFLIHILCTLICSLIFEKICKVKTFSTKLPEPKNFDNGIFYDSVLSSATAILCVGFIVAITYYVLQILTTLKVVDFISYLFCLLGFNSEIATSITLGVFEVGLGLGGFSHYLSPLTLAIVSALVSFGGISNLVQSLFFLKNAKIKTAPFISFSIIKAVFSFVIGFVVFFVIFGVF